MYHLARIDVRRDGTIYIMGKKQVTVPLDRLIAYGFEIVCSFEQNGNAYLILKDDE